MGQTGWKSELSLLDEFFGQEPRYPLATKVEHQAYELHKQNELLKKLSSNQRLELKNTTSAVCGSLENGFGKLYEVNTKGFKSIVSAVDRAQEEITSTLYQVNRNLEQINATLNWGFSAVLEQLTISNHKLDQIIHLLNIPDSQKQRKYHIEQGYEFIKKTKINPIFYNKSKQHFEDAIKIEDSDYLSLQQLGIIYLYSKELLDLELSEKYLEKSILYSNSDIGFSHNQQNPSSFHFTYNPSKITATSLMHLARIFFIKEEYIKSYDTAKKGIDIYEMVGIHYDISKYAFALNKEKQAIFHLNKAISMDRYITVKTINEELLIKQPSVHILLNNLAVNTNKKANMDLIEIKQIVHNNSAYKDEVENIEKLVNAKTYLNSLIALENIGYELYN
jgi:tetratricopeptide (TPR) repeat protein